MPTAGDEGYETLVICPYDRAHEIRKGRLQFHLEKCRKNYPMAEKAECPFNSTHLVNKVELDYHTQAECTSRHVWDRSVYDVGDQNCPVKDLIPISAHPTVPDGGENWDDFESTGSVLNHIKETAEKKPIIRNFQCESRGKRRDSRAAHRERINELLLEVNNQSIFNSPLEQVPPSEPLPRPTRMPMIPVKRQDPSEAAAALSNQFRSQDMNMKQPGKKSFSASSSMVNGPPSEFGYSLDFPASTSKKSYPASVTSCSTMGQGDPTESRESTRPSTPMSSSVSRSSRPSTAMSIAASVSRAASDGPRASGHRRLEVDDEGFCKVPIPGLGRGRKLPKPTK